MKHERVKLALNNLPNLGVEGEDIAYAIQDEAEFSRSWVNDCILSQYIKQTGDKRLNAQTRKLIKAKSYDAYIGLSKQIHRDMMAKAQRLLSEIKDQ